MKRKQLGTSTLKFTELGLGCWVFAGGGIWGDQEERDSREAVRAALDAGINWFDTAEGYGAGASEKILGKALAGESREAQVATKVAGPHLAPEDLRQACEASLARLGREAIDYYQIHWPNAEVPIEDTVGALKDLVAEGKIRHFGVSNFGPQQLAGYLRSGGMASANQVSYNLLSRAIEYAIIPAVVEAGMGLLAYSPLMQGLLTGKFKGLEDFPEGRSRTRHFSSERTEVRHGESGQEVLIESTLQALIAIAGEAGRPLAELAIRWLLDRGEGEVTAVIVGGRNARQVERNALAAREPLGADLLAALDGTTEKLKAAMGPNADLWESPGRVQ